MNVCWRNEWYDNVYKYCFFFNSLTSFLCTSRGIVSYECLNVYFECVYVYIKRMVNDSISLLLFPSFFFSRSILRLRHARAKHLNVINDTQHIIILQTKKEEENTYLFYLSNHRMINDWWYCYNRCSFFFVRWWLLLPHFH